MTKKQILVRINEEKVVEFKVLLAQKRITMQEVMEKMILEWIESSKS